MAPTRTRGNVFTGYGDLYYGSATDSPAMPAETVARGGGWPVAWTGFGFTEDGMEYEISKDVEDQNVEEMLTPASVALTGAQILLRFTLAEDVLANMIVAAGIGTLTTTAPGVGQIGKTTLTLGESLKQYAFGFESDNPEGHWRRGIVPLVISTGSVGVPYRRNNKRIYPVEFRAICELDDIVIVNKTANAS